MPENPKPPCLIRSIFSFTLQELFVVLLSALSISDVTRRGGGGATTLCTGSGCASNASVAKDLGPLTVDLACLDRIADSLGALAVHLAANRESSTQDLLDGALQALGERLEAHCPCDLDDLVQGDRLVVLDVLLLLAVARGLLQGADDKGRGGGDDGNGGLTVLDRELDGDAETLLRVVKLRTCKLRILGVVSRLVRRGSGMAGGFRTQSPVALAMSSPTFLGERPRGPILGARAEEAPTSPPVARRWLLLISQHCDDRDRGRRGRNCARASSLSSTMEGQVGFCVHDLHLIGVELGSCGQVAR